MKVAVIGAGTYGSYIIDAVSRRFPDCEITLYEVGSAIIKSESEIGFKSNITDKKYDALSKGRFFGLGGTSTKWGGQILTFSENDFSEASNYLNEIVRLNKEYKEKVFSKFGIKYNYSENRITENFFIKTGIWLGYFNRNLFKYFKIRRYKNVKIITNARVIRIISNENKRIDKIVIKKDNKEFEADYDFYFLTAGAFESTRILMASKIIPESKANFSDHLSQKVFKIKGGTKINNEDFSFRIKGTSLITKRIIGEIDGVSFFVNPIFNSEFPFFNNLKKLLFQRTLDLNIIKSLLSDLPSFFLFIWNLIFLRKLYVYKGEWYLYIDTENFIGGNHISLSTVKDKFGEAALNVTFSIDSDITLIFERAKNLVKEYLLNNNVNFEECYEKIEVEKYEDTYHPFGMLSNFNSVDDYYNMFQNMLVVNTGILPRAGGINLTAAVFPLVEEYISNYMKQWN